MCGRATQAEGGDVKEYLYKILVVGDIGTGKTSIIKRYVHNIFSQHYKSTVRTRPARAERTLRSRLEGRSHARAHTQSRHAGTGTDQIGVDFALKVLQWDADTVVRLQLWDIAGQERFGNMTRVSAP